MLLTIIDSMAVMCLVTLWILKAFESVDYWLSCKLFDSVKSVVYSNSFWSFVRLFGVLVQ